VVDAQNLRKVQALVCTGAMQLGRADAELCRFPALWAAAGYPHVVFRLTPAALEQPTRAPVADGVELPVSAGEARAPVGAGAEVRSTEGHP